jgi:hypothetical protein
MTYVQQNSSQTTSFTFNSLVTEVLTKVENRQTYTTNALNWIRDAVLEISGNPRLRLNFDQLEVLGTPYNLQATVQEYDESNLIPSGNLNLGTLDIMLWLDPPANTQRRRLEKTNFQETDKVTYSSGPPSQWYRFGANIGFNPIPDTTYQVQTRMLMMHPINDSALATTPILLPRDWNDIIVLAAAEKGFVELGNYDKAGSIHRMLHGDPRDSANLGMLYSRKFRQEQEDWRQEKCLRPIVGRYGWR